MHSRSPASPLYGMEPNSGGIGGLNGWLPRIHLECQRRVGYGQRAEVGDVRRRNWRISKPDDEALDQLLLLLLLLLFIVQNVHYCISKEQIA